MELLKKGIANSLGVVELQARLNSLSFSTGIASLIVNGEFNDATEIAVKAFQHLNHLMADGIVGDITWKHILEQSGNKLLFLFLHCSASPEGLDINGAWIIRYHTVTKGWSRPGYSDVIELSGKIANIYPWDNDADVEAWEFTFGTLKLNRSARHICYIGGVSATDKDKAKDTRTAAQKASMKTYIEFTLKMHPDIIIVGHNQVQQKACPSFDVPTYLRSINVEEKNIAQWGKLYV